MEAKTLPRSSSPTAAAPSELRVHKITTDELKKSLAEIKDKTNLFD